MKPTLVVAFDGLDYELIKEFDCENIKQQSFGHIDNSTDTKSIKTSELFANLITGKNYEQHGIEGLSVWTNPRIGKLEKLISRLPYSNKTSELRQAVYESLGFLSAKKMRPDKTFLEEETVFEKIDNSRAMFVPTYNPSEYWQMGLDMTPLEYGFSAQKSLEIWDTREHQHRKKELFHELESEILPARDLLMCHFHRPDIHQHIYGDPDTSSFNKDRLRKLYQETDELAAEIKEKAESAGYEEIVFMSDHGLPEGEQHNTNAFWSSSAQSSVSKVSLKDFFERLTGDDFSFH
jgi:hypothetical protein